MSCKYCYLVRLSSFPNFVIESVSVMTPCVLCIWFFFPLVTKFYYASVGYFVACVGIVYLNSYYFMCCMSLCFSTWVTLCMRYNGFAVPVRIRWRIWSVWYKANGSWPNDIKKVTVLLCKLGRTTGIYFPVYHPISSYPCRILEKVKFNDYLNLND